MNFKHSSFLFGSIVLSAALAFFGCDSSSSTTADDDDDEEEVVVNKKSSSSTKDDDEISSDSKSAVDDGNVDVDEYLVAPLNMAAVRLAPSVWQLSFTYRNANADGFVVQRLPEAGGSWKDYTELKSGVTRLILDGSSKGGYFYRVAAKSGKAISPYSEEVLVSAATAYDTGLSLETPQAVPNINQEMVLELVLTDKMATSGMINSAYNFDSTGKAKGSVSYQARFVYGEKLTADTVKVSADQISVSKTFKTSDDQCNSYAQIRLVWTDKNKVSDYSEWSAPMGTKSGTDANLINTNKFCSNASADVVVESRDLPSPSGVSPAKQPDGSWVLQWSFTPSKIRPESGFIVQKLDLVKSKWVDFDTTGAGVYRCLLGKLTEAYSYYRVVTFDKQGRSSYSADVLVAGNMEEDAKLSTPKGISFVRIAPSIWELSWKYEVADENPKNKFIIQSSKLANFKWSTFATVDGSNRVFSIQSQEYIESYFRMAITDGKDTSLFSEAVQLTPDVAYRPDMDLKMPVLSTQFWLHYTLAYDVDLDTATKNERTYQGAEIIFDVSNNYANHYIYESENTDTVYYQARWFTPTEYTPRGDEYNHFSEDSTTDANGKKIVRDTVGETWIESFGYDEPSIKLSRLAYDDTITYGGKTMSLRNYCEALYDYDSEVHSKALDGDKGALATERSVSYCVKNYAQMICDYRIQVRIVWTDVNGYTAYSEWTAPDRAGNHIDGLCDL